MSACFVCGSDLSEGARSCAVCGTSVPVAPSPPVDPAPAAAVAPTAAATGARICPVCLTRYDASYPDSFCECGAGLTPDLSLERVAEAADRAPALEASVAGPRLVVYSADRQPIHTLALDRDVIRLGRTDAVRGDFVDLDVSRFFDEATARKVSRKHAVVLRSRETQAFTLRPLAGNTGTQIEGELAKELEDYPLKDGTRIILGGVVRPKFVTSGTR